MTDPGSEMLRVVLCEGLGRMRVALCDLLYGRKFRIHAADFLADALEVERLGAPACVVDRAIERAARAEWIATISEQGRVAWGGGRKNRCGSPEGDPWEEPCPPE